MNNYHHVAKPADVNNVSDPGACVNFLYSEAVGSLMEQKHIFHNLNKM